MDFFKQTFREGLIMGILNSVKNLARNCVAKVKSVAAKVAVLATASVATAAHAALPAGVAIGFTQVQSDGLEMADLAWPAVISLSIAIILFKLYKRFIGKV